MGDNTKHDQAGRNKTRTPRRKKGPLTQHPTHQIKTGKNTTLFSNLERPKGAPNYAFRQNLSIDVTRISQYRPFHDIFIMIMIMILWSWSWSSAYCIYRGPCYHVRLCHDLSNFYTSCCEVKYEFARVPYYNTIERDITLHERIMSWIMSSQQNTLFPNKIVISRFDILCEADMKSEYLHRNCTYPTPWIWHD